MAERVKVGVIGVGALGEHHARLYAQSPRAELVGVVDIREDRARDIAARFECRAWTDFTELLPHVEAVSLAVPTQEHSRIGREVMEKGIHVLVEKPIASSLQEADQLLEAEQEAGVVFHVGQSERFNPALLSVIDRIREPRFFEAHRLGIFVPRGLDIDVVLDLMIHDLDLILQLVPSPLVEVRAVGIPVLTPRVDIANARLQFQNGAVANITASRVSNEKIRKLRLFQMNDYISIDFHRQDVEMFSLIQDPASPEISRRELKVEKGEPLKAEIETFLSTVRGEPDSAIPVSGCSGAQGRRALGLALRVLETIKMQKTSSPLPNS